MVGLALEMWLDVSTIKGGFHQHQLNHRFTELQLFLTAS